MPEKTKCKRKRLVLDLPTGEFVRKVAEEGEETELARKFREKKRKSG